MKNIIRIIAVAVLMAGCTVQEQGQGQLEERSEPIGEVKSPVFRASFEGADTKTYLSSNKCLHWTEDDRLSIFITTYNQQYRFMGETGDNSGDFTEVKAPGFHSGNKISTNYAVYPYIAGTKISDDESLTVSLPSVQGVADRSFGLGANTMVAVTSSPDDYFLEFRNLCGYLVLKFYGEGTVGSITLRGNNGEKLAGNASVVAGYGEDPQTTMSDTATDSITLDCGEDGVTLGASASEATEFWFCVPPVTFSKGFTVTVTDVNGEAFHKGVGSSKTITRNVINTLSALQVNFSAEEVSTTPEAVDLGLSVKWANCNVGATKPEKYGDYFAWGETEPKSDYSWSTLKYCTEVVTDECVNFSKYVTDSIYGTVDDMTVLEASDDVAHVKWGGSWRMPTIAEWNELQNNCTWTWTTQNEVNGYKVTSNKPGYTSKSIFLPAAGYRAFTSLNNVGSGGYYWLSSLYTGNPYGAGFHFFSGGVVAGGDDRYLGLSVRPVSGDPVVAVTSVTLSKTTASLKEGETLSLTATVIPSNATDKSVTWSSSNTGVATVDQSGKVTAVKVGSATITVTTKDGGYKAACSVSVSDPVPVMDAPVNVEYDLGDIKYSTLSRDFSVPRHVILDALKMNADEFVTYFKSPSGSGIPVGYVALCDKYSSNLITCSLSNKTMLGAGSVTYTFPAADDYTTIKPASITVRWNVVNDFPALVLNPDYILYADAERTELDVSDAWYDVDTILAVTGKMNPQSSIKDHLKNYEAYLEVNNYTNLSMKLTEQRNGANPAAYIFPTNETPYSLQGIFLNGDYSALTGGYKDFVVSAYADLANGQEILVKEYIVRFVCPFVVKCSDIVLHTHSNDYCEAQAEVSIVEYGTEMTLATIVNTAYSARVDISQYAQYTYPDTFTDMKMPDYELFADASFNAYPEWGDKLFGGNSKVLGAMQFGPWFLWWYDGILPADKQCSYTATITLGSEYGTISGTGNITILSSAHSTSAHTGHVSEGHSSPFGQFMAEMMAESSSSDVAEEPYVELGGEKYRIVKMKDGRWWMAENLRYIPEGCEIGNGVYYPCKDDALASDDTPEGIKAKGLLYADNIVFKTTLTADNYLTGVEGVQGICPDGWHIPTCAEFMNLVGKNNDSTGYPTIETAPYFDATLGNGGNGSMAMLEADGFSTRQAGYINNDAVAGYVASKGAITLTYIYSSTGKPNPTATSCQMYALMFNSANGTCPVGFMANSLSAKPLCGSVRCIKNE